MQIHLLFECGEDCFTSPRSTLVSASSSSLCACVMCWSGAIACVVSIRLACFTMISSNRFCRFTSFRLLASFSPTHTYSPRTPHTHIPFTICAFRNRIMQCINVPFPANIIPHTSCLMQSIHISNSAIHPSKRFSFSIQFTHIWKSFLFVTRLYIQIWMSMRNLWKNVSAI